MDTLDREQEHYVTQRTVMDAFNKTTYYPKDPEVGFGTGSRPPLSEPTLGPGPGAYQIKTTMGKVAESHITSPSAFSIRGRTAFGDPNAKATSKGTIDLPGPGQYDLTGKFPRGKNPRKSAFPKGPAMGTVKTSMGPGPGSYGTTESVGKQVLSTKDSSPVVAFGKQERPSMVPHGLSEVGPGQYKPPPAACEDQIDSRKPTCGKIKIGDGYRKGSRSEKFNFSEPSPGPMTYVIPPRKMKGISMSGREKFGSPW